MKALLLVILSVSLAAAVEPLTLKLTYKEGEEVDYAAQIQAGFTKLLESNSTLAKEFTRFESPPPEYARGRYSGEPIILPIVLSEEEHVDFRDTGGKKEIKKTIALYYRFDEGMHRGRQTSSGFFALFAVTGDFTYRHLANDDFELSESTIVAKFQGLSRDLVAPKPEEDQAEQDGGGQPATRPESK